MSTTAETTGVTAGARPVGAAQELVHFHVLGHTLGRHRQAEAHLIPAVLAPYRDLAALRHDFPVVLTDEPPFIHALTDLVDQALRQLAPRGSAGERLRRSALRTETEIRRRAAAGEVGTLGERWDAAEPDDAPADLAAVRDALPLDGRVLDCHVDIAADVVAHVWRLRRRQADREVRGRIDQLVLGLIDILRAQDARSDEGRSSERLSAGVGGDQRDAFDFEGWSAILRTGPAAAVMPPARRARIESAIEVLGGQGFFPSAADTDPTHDEFLFTSCAAAAEAYVARVPEMVELVRAMSIAELELQNGYRESIHDPVFEQFDEWSLTADDVASFPTYLVCTTDRELTSTEQAQLVGILGSDAPIDVLVQVRDVLGVPGGLPLTNGSAPSSIGRRLGTMAMGLGTAFVLQTVSSNLVHVREQVDRGLVSTRPALFSVFTGSADLVPQLPPYLTAATAMQSRTAPTFVFDPDAGSTWAERFDVWTNPDPRAVWASLIVGYADAEMQRQREEVHVTPIDFAALDRRYGHHFTVAPPTVWTDDMLPAAAMIDGAGTAANGHVPYLLMVDDDDVLHRVVVDRQLLREVRQYETTWRSIQELAGINNSHAVTLLEVERARWEEERALERASAGHGDADDRDEVGAPVAPSEFAEPPSVEAIDETADADDADGDAHIETARCTTCDECTKLNPRMFAYDENKQAYLADRAAGTYRQLVEAAEACQVAIIHPGAPWDPSEPDLDELVARAAAFA